MSRNVPSSSTQHFVIEQIQSTSGNSAKTRRTVAIVHGRWRSDEFSHPITSPVVWRNPLLIASYWPPSGSLHHQASRSS